MQDLGNRIEKHFSSRNGFRSIKIQRRMVTMIGTYGPGDRVRFSVDPYISIVYSVVPPKIYWDEAK
jgi:hypothetical protein